jgi:hypothetical protein
MERCGWAVYLSRNRWIPLYIGQTNSFATRLPNHERLDKAIRLGATHIHTRIERKQSDRDILEKALIQHLQPNMNRQLR